MKSRLMLITGMAVLWTLSASAQSDTNTAPPTVAQKSFDQMKALTGSWEGRVSTVPIDPDMDGHLTRVTLRVTSRGNAIIHEMKEAGKPDDPTRYDDPITMFYLEGDRLLLTHYCDAGNRPRMAGKMTSDGKAVDFEFLDVAGGTQNGHMHHALFTPVDGNHHSEEWTYMAPGDKLVHARLDLQRAK